MRELEPHLEHPPLSAQASLARGILKFPSTLISSFVLVDDGTTGQFHGEIELRTAVERKICEVFEIQGVCVVLQGGPGTFKTVKASLQAEAQVLLLSDSGGCAEVVSEFIAPLQECMAELTRKDEVRTKRIKDRATEFKPRLAEMMPLLTNDSVTEVMEHLRNGALFWTPLAQVRLGVANEPKQTPQIIVVCFKFPLTPGSRFFKL